MLSKTWTAVWGFVAILSLLAPAVLAQDERPEVELADIMAELTEALNLTEEQVPAVESALVGYLHNMDAAQAKYEDVEEPDPQAMLGDFKKVQADYQKELKGILSKEQMEQYVALKEQILHEVFSEIALLRLLDLKEPLTLSDEQMDAMKPVMGTSLRGVFGTIIKYGDKRMGVRTKLKIATALKGIKKEQDAAMAKILSPEQIAAWDALKESQKG